MQNQNVVESSLDDNLDLSFLDDLDDLIDGEILAEHQEIVEDDEVDLLLSAVDEVEDEDEMAEMYASQVADESIIEVHEVVSVEGNEQPILAAAVSATLGAKQAAKVHKSRSVLTSSRILSKLATEAVDYTTLTPDCTNKSEAEQLADFSVIVDDMANYVADKAVNLFGFLKTGGGLNGVTNRGFNVLLTDGRITGGKQGNLYLNLLSKPYSPGTASSQSSQIFQLFIDLKIADKAPGGAIVINPDSVILDRVKTILGK